MSDIRASSRGASDCRSMSVTATYSGVRASIQRWRHRRTSPRARHACRLLFVFLIGFLVYGAVLATAQSSNEYRLKAAFVYRFPQFVEWPAAALNEARTLDICVLFPNPFGTDLEQLVQGESLNGRPLRVRTIRAVGATADCHAIFAGVNSQAAQMLKSVAGRPILTIGETPDFLAAGGSIVLHVIDRRVRFEVNTRNVQRAGLQIDAQLLHLAAAVHGGAP
jgi:hypothetical protein